MTITTIGGNISHGVILERGNYGVSLTVAHSGKINSTSFGVYAQYYAPGLEIVNDGLIGARLVAIDMAGGQIVNAGSINGTTFGIVDEYHGRILNSGTISGGSAYAVGLSANASLDNTGFVDATGAGVVLRGATLTNTGAVHAQQLGVYISQGAIYNFGSIYGETVGIGFDGPTIIGSRPNAVSDLTNAAGGVISSAEVGVSLLAQTNAPASLSNAGSIFGSIEGVFLENASLTNAGVIKSDTLGVAVYGGQISNFGSIYGTTIGLDFIGPTLTGIGPFAISEMTNVSGGIISSAKVAVSLRGQAAAPPTFSNAGSISGNISGVFLENASLINSGVINGGTAGVALYSGSVMNTGYIGGDTYGVYIKAGALTNSGTISGTSYAVKGLNSFALNVVAGAMFDGKLMDVSGDGQINLIGTTAGTLAGFGTSIFGFSTIKFEERIWTVEGNLAGLANGPTISGFYQGDTIVITDFAASSAVYNRGSGLTLSNGATSKILNVYNGGNYRGYAAVYTERGKTYIISDPLHEITNFIPTPGTNSVVSTSTGVSVTPGEGNYAVGVTIASSVTINTSTGPALIVPRRVSNANVVNFGLITSSIQDAGVYLSGPTSLTNYGEISTEMIMGGGTLTNLGLIKGFIFLGGSDLTNSGTIKNGIQLTGRGNIDNTGHIVATDSNGISFYGETLTNSGHISGNAYGVKFTQEYLTGGLYNSGSIYGTEAGISFTPPLHDNTDNIINTGSIGGGRSGIVLVVNGTVVNAGTISGNKYAIDGSAVGNENALHLIADPGAVFQGAVVDHSEMGQLTLAGSTAGSLDMGTSFTGFQDIAFATGSQWSLEGAVNDLAGGQSITGFSAGDTIELDGFSAISHTYVTGTGLVLSNGETTETLDIAGNFSTDSFLVSTNEAGTEMVVCYLRGTKILTPAGEIAVEALKIGDPVITRFNGYRPIKWIGRQSYAKRFVRNNRAQIPVKIAAGALGPNLPKRDLSISPGHSMLINGVLIMATALVNGVTITQDDVPEEIHYYHLEFETHDCVLAEGAWSESYADTPGLRHQFHNVAEFHDIYPEYREPEIETLCAARAAFGDVLQAALRPIASRALAGVKPGALRGWIDHANAGRLEGWAQDIDHPELPVLLEVVIDGRVAGTVLACGYRDDLEKAGLGRGRCQFSFALPAKISRKIRRTIRVRRAIDGAEIYMSEACKTALGIKKPLRMAS